MERFFLQLLEPFDRDDLDGAVESDVSLLDETLKGNPRALVVAERLAGRFRGQANLLTVENVLKWVKEKRYELYFAFISNPKARAWIERQVREFRMYLFE